MRFQLCPKFLARSDHAARRVDAQQNALDAVFCSIFAEIFDDIARVHYGPVEVRARIEGFSTFSVGERRATAMANFDQKRTQKDHDHKKE